jgi:uncharacterized surface protein with fasciclin (FAS1) repeats
MRAVRMVVAVPALMAMTACADEGPTAAAFDGTASMNRSAAAAPAAVKAARTPTVVDVALAVNAESGEFSTLIAAVLAAGLADELSANGQRTVFAPTDAAFAALGLDADNIGELQVAALQNILLYHVAPGRRYAESVVVSSRMRMANGGFTSIRLEAGEAYINGSKIVGTDVEATNGIIHVIDAVLLP